LAFFKDVLLAAYLGTSLQADALTIAYFLPDTIGSSLLAAAIGTACVPVFSGLYAHRKREALGRSVRNAALTFSLLAFIITVAIYLYIGNVTGWITGSPDSEFTSMTVGLSRTILPTIVLFPVIAIGTSLLQTWGLFTVPAAMPLLTHGIVIAAVLLNLVLGVPRDHAVYGISLAMTLGVVSMAVIVWTVIYKKESYGEADRSWNPLNSRIVWLNQIRIWKVFIPYILILLSGQSVYFVERKLASAISAGTVAGLNYAFRLSQFPILVFVAAVYSVILPTLSQDLALGHWDKLRMTVVKALKQILLVTVPTTSLFFFLRVPIVSVLFQRGAFDEESVRITSSVLAGYSLTIVSLSLSAVCLRFFLAAGRIWIPLAVFLFSASVNIVADYLWIGPLGAAGLGYGAAVGAAVNALSLVALLMKRLKLTWKFRFLERIAVANLVPLLLIVPSSVVWPLFAHSWNSLQKIGFLFIAVSASAGGYWVVLRRLKLI
jgi:putative peptidoglycan lipid II flippase